ncbi:carbonic anhydrase [Candidatus Methylopumilus universalis]|jgi:carbonic anhydrase|uniref:carbonic anhydrase n=1 Tax=Candidatus Methylopumilus universalis TaxID=2588536 RepID=UPI0011205FB7|nr:carbonic anhydrase [Candidatus Methylopumilus universalis]QDC80456.1 carbonic anhydrase [Candidatus Methylopumilus universalis]QDC81757.1 carbonic anhydrase [Candidatus Methylopumilus universalis]QDC88199.1 carbonic anhydrase [Candidatus Methylopumilus universalis]
MYRHPEIDRDHLTPRQALDILIEGNQRFKNNVLREHDMLRVRDETVDKQHPFASVLSCSDSRTTVELIFDQNLGDIFSVRLAGNIASIKAIGSLEFSCKYLGSKLVVVMGHTNCGAIKAACDHYKGGNIGEIIELIDPAVLLEKTITDKRDSSNDAFVERVCFHNVEVQMERILKRSPLLTDMIEKKEIGLVGAVYNLASGEVEFDLNHIHF